MDSNVELDNDDEYEEEYFDDRICSYPCEWCGEIEDEDENVEDEKE